MHLRLVSSEEKDNKTETVSEATTTGETSVPIKLTGNTKLYILAVILGVVPIIAYRTGVHHWGYETATHIGFFVGLCCMLCAVGLLYMANWREDLS